MTPRKTFREIVKEARWGNAQRLWQKAQVASRLRHDARALGQWKSGRSLSEVKLQAVRRVCEIAPDLVRTRSDRWRHPGLLSVRFGNAGALHVKPGAEVLVLSALRLPRPDWRGPGHFGAPVSTGGHAVR